MPTIKTSDTEIPDLDILLSHIRLSGISVGNPEMLRLQSVFVQAPSLSRNEIRILLIAVLAKDEWQRNQIRRVYDRLVPYELEELGEAKQLGELYRERLDLKPRLPSNEQSAEEDSPDTEGKESFNWKDLAFKVFVAGLIAWSVFIIAAFFVFIIELLIVFLSQTGGAKISSTDNLSHPEQEQHLVKKLVKRPSEKSLKLIKTIDHWVPNIKSQPRDPRPQLLSALLFLLTSGLGFSWLLYKASLASRQQQARRPKPIKESGRFHVSGISKLTDYHLLNGEQRRELRWGISRYQSEQSLNRLNIPVSVKRSAMAGMPELVFENSNHEREVWLWQDSSSTNLDLSRLVDEINHTLQRANVRVQRSYFRGIPSTFSNAQGQVLWSNRHDYPETKPIVVVFSDSEKLQARQQSNPESSYRNLQQLSHWPLLCFVDGSHQGGTLQRCLYPHDLECVLPQAAVNWLANQGQGGLQATDNFELDSFHQWAVACALPNRVIMEDEIRALHNVLELDCAWQFHSLTRYAKTSGRGFDFRSQRIKLLNELKLNSDSDFATSAVQFWIDRSCDLDKALKVKQQTGSTWENTRKQRLLERDNALLQLWCVDKQNTKQSLNAVKSAVKTLYDLYADKSLQKDISRELGHYYCNGFKPLVAPSTNTSKQINLPFEWQDLRAETQRQLLYCGFSGVPDPNVKLLWDKPTKVILVGLAAIMVLSLLASIHLLMPKPPKFVTKLDSLEPPEFNLIPSLQGGDYLISTFKSIGYDRRPHSVKDYQTQAKDKLFTLSWQRQEAPAQTSIGDDSYSSVQHWLLGTIAEPKRPKPTDFEWPDLSIVVIFGNPSDKVIRKLAAKLLDTGSADQVLIGIGQELKEQHEKLLNQTEQIKDSQWVYINGGILEGHKSMSGKRVTSIKQLPEKLLQLLRQSNDLLILKMLDNVTIQSFGNDSLLQARKE